MNKNPGKLLWPLALVGTFLLLSTAGLSGQTANTNADSSSVEDQQFKRLDDELRKMLSDPGRNWDKFESVARAMIKEFPDRPDGYQFLMDEIQSVRSDRARILAREMADSNAPEHLRLWAKGFLHRLDSFGQPVEMRFVVLDGQMVDLSRMRGKVVLIDFWGIDCVPCVAELPEIKAAYDKFHNQGFEVVGISQDTNTARLKKFTKENNMLWPQYIDGDHKLAQEFGIAGIPHTLLLDKSGCIRADDTGKTGILMTSDALEKGLAQLLSEQ